MAYLVLKDERTYADEWDDTEKFYEFDPSDKESVDRIHQILSMRKYGVIKNCETVLAGICEKTLSRAPIVKAEPLTRQILKKVKKFLGSSSNTRKKILRKQPPAAPACPCKCLSVQLSLKQIQ